MFTKSYHGVAIQKKPLQQYFCMVHVPFVFQYISKGFMIVFLLCYPGNSGCGVWILTVAKPLIYGNRITACGDSGVALVSNSDLHHDNQQLSSQFVQSEQEVRRSVPVSGR